MFLDELTPFVQELARQPVAFLGGFVSGVLRLDLADEPVKGWLAAQDAGVPLDTVDNSASSPEKGPQKISID